MGIIQTFSAIQAGLGKAILIPQPTTDLLGTGGSTNTASQVAGALINTFVFQYFPESLSDQQNANYASIDIPGGSHPLQQWISGGARTINFQAKFASERIVPPGEVDLLNKHNVSINGALWSLRYFLYPTYDDKKVIKAQPPPRLWLFITGTWLSAPNPIVSVILKNLNVEVKQWHAVGIPKLAIVDLSFEETVQSPFSGVQFKDRNDFAFPKYLYTPRL